MQVADRVREAPDHVRGDDVARHADHEQVAKPLVEDQLGWHPRIAARQDRRERLLRLLQVFAPGRRLVCVGHAARDKAEVAFLEPGERLGGVLWPRIGRRVVALRPGRGRRLRYTGGSSNQAALGNRGIVHIQTPVAYTRIASLRAGHRVSQPSISNPMAAIQLPATRTTTRGPLRPHRRHLTGRQRYQHKQRAHDTRHREHPALGGIQLPAIPQSVRCTEHRRQSDHHGQRQPSVRRHQPA